GRALALAAGQRTGIAVHRRRPLGRGRRSRGGGRRCRGRAGGRGRRAALEPVEAAIQVQVLVAAAVAPLLLLVLQLLQLRAQRLHFGLERGDLVEQVDVALVVGR